MNTAPFSSGPAARASRHSLLAFAGRVFAAMAVTFSSWGSPDLPESDRALAATLGTNHALGLELCTTPDCDLPRP